MRRAIYKFWKTPFAKIYGSSCGHFEAGAHHLHLVNFCRSHFILAVKFRNYYWQVATMNGEKSKVWERNEQMVEMHSYFIYGTVKIVNLKQFIR